MTTGVNLPMILELTLKKDSTEFNEWCAMAKEIGIQGIVTKMIFLRRWRTKICQ